LKGKGKVTVEERGGAEEEEEEEEVEHIGESSERQKD